MVLVMMNNTTTIQAGTRINFKGAIGCDPHSETVSAVDEGRDLVRFAGGRAMPLGILRSLISIGKAHTEVSAA